MHHVTRMLETHPQATASDALARCIQECVACALACTSCADACLAEERVQQLVRCIRLNLDCADVCDATGRVLTRQRVPSQRWRGACSTPARRPAAYVRRSASGTRPTMSTAAFARKLVGVASRRVRTCVARSAVRVSKAPTDI
jgi:hypothetical protein